jgi:hypothetical protein
VSLTGSSREWVAPVIPARRDIDAARIAEYNDYLTAEKLIQLRVPAVVPGTFINSDSEPVDRETHAESDSIARESESNDDDDDPLDDINKTRLAENRDGLYAAAVSARLDNGPAKRS